MSLVKVLNKEQIKQIIERCKITTEYGDVVLFTNGNGWYINTLIKNLLVSMNIYEPEYYQNLIVFCSDEDGLGRCKDENFPNYEYVDIPTLDVSSFSSNTKNDIDIYTRLCFVKVAIMSYVLELGYIGLYIDPDMAFTDKAIEHLLKNISKKDITFAGTFQYLNSNIMICKPEPIIKELYNFSTQHVDYIVKTQGLYSDEDLFRSRLHTIQDCVGFLESMFYPPGCDLPTYRSYCKMAHANCVSGLDNKIQLLKENKSWFI
jgi:hypothetical protein